PTYWSALRRGGQQPNGARRARPRPRDLQAPSGQFGRSRECPPHQGGRARRGGTEEEMVITDIQTLVTIAPNEQANVRVSGDVGAMTSRGTITRAAMEALGAIGSQHADMRKQVWPLRIGQLGKGDAITSSAINALRGVGRARSRRCQL